MSDAVASREFFQARASYSVARFRSICSAPPAPPEPCPTKRRKAILVSLSDRKQADYRVLSRKVSADEALAMVMGGRQ